MRQTHSWGWKNPGDCTCFVPRLRALRCAESSQKPNLTSKRHRHLLVLLHDEKYRRQAGQSLPIRRLLRSASTNLYLSRALTISLLKKSEGGGSSDTAMRSKRRRRNHLTLLSSSIAQVHQYLHTSRS